MSDTERRLAAVLDAAVADIYRDHGHDDEAADEIPAQVAISFEVRRRIGDWLRGRADAIARAAEVTDA